MKCPACGGAELLHEIRNLPYTYKGKQTVLPAVTGDFCPACAESVLDAAESERVMREMLAFNRQVNAAAVDPGFIATVRKKLGLDQREAAESTPSHAMRPAEQNRRWPWSSCSRCLTATPTCYMKSGRRERSCCGERRAEHAHH